MMHPTKSIKGKINKSLKNRRIVLGITGSIAAIISVKLSRELIRRGAEVIAVTTDSALNIIHEYALGYATGNPVITEISGSIEHIREVGESGDSDLFLIAPCTANTIGKIVSGIDDSPVTTFATTAMASDIPILIAPAMSKNMYDHPAVDRNVKDLKKMGVSFVNPVVEEEKAKMADISNILFDVESEFTKSDLSDKKILVTGGATTQNIDEIRVITNRSSGRMGLNLAETSAKRGADVTYIKGKTSVPDPRGVTTIFAESFSDMKDKVIFELQSKDYDIMISSAAVSDFIPKKQRQGQKISSDKPLTLKMKPCKKIINQVIDKFPDVDVVSFKLESSLEKSIEKGRELISSSDIELVVSNSASSMGNNQIEACVISKHTEKKITGDKRYLSNKMLDILVDEIYGKKR